MSAALGRRIKSLRRLKLITQQKLAQKINISVTMLSNFERGAKTPSPQLLEEIARQLEIHAGELFSLYGEDNDNKVNMTKS